MIALIFLAIWATLVRAQACDGDAQPLLWAVQRRDAPHAVALVVRAFAFCFFLFLFSKSSVFGGVAVAVSVRGSWAKWRSGCRRRLSAWR